MKAKILFINAIALIIGLSSCKKEAGPTGATGAQGSAGPVLTENLKGFINHYDVSGTKLANGLAGDSVTILIWVVAVSINPDLIVSDRGRRPGDAAARAIPDPLAVHIELDSLERPDHTANCGRESSRTIDFNRHVCLRLD